MLTERQLLQSKIHVLGYFSTKLAEGFNFSHQFSEALNDSLRQSAIKKKVTEFNPVSIMVQTNSISIVDKQNKGWLITDFLVQPICLSELLKLKIFKIALGYNQLIATTRQGCFLVSWGNKKPINDGQLSKQKVKNTRSRYAHLFDIYFIEQSVKKDNFMFSTLKKTVDSHSLFCIPFEKPQAIVSFPSLERISIGAKVVGFSIGKYHSLCWDIDGKLYSWGCKTLALGCKRLGQDEENKVPKLVSEVKGFVLKAYAGSNYSLAITLEGKLFEWGIKKNSGIGQELIFQPRQIPVGEGQKIIDLKGKGQRYGVLTLSGNLYVWGKNMKQCFLSSHQNQLRSDLSIQLPTALPSEYRHIIDFSISDTVVGIVSSVSRCTMISECQERYWGKLKEKVRISLRYCEGKVGTEGEGQKQNRGRSLLKNCFSLRKFVDPVQIALNHKKAKNQYIEAASESDNVLNFLMRPSDNSQAKYRIPHDSSDKIMSKKQKSLPLPIRRLKTQSGNIDQLLNKCQKGKQFVNVLQNQIKVDKQRKSNLKKILKGNYQTTKRQQNSYLQKSYEEKRDIVLRKKQEINNIFFQKTQKKIANNSFETRMKKRFENQELRRKKKEVQTCQSTLQQILIRSFVVKLFQKTVSQSRELKISNFGNRLKMQRLQSNIRGVFVKNRIKLKMKNMSKNNLFRFTLLAMVFKRYVKSFRQRKYKRLRKLVTRQVFKSVIKEKIKVGISACIFNIRKLQKFREWTAMVKSERKKCLKYMWKVYLLSFMKLNSDHDSASSSYLPKKLQEFSFEKLYQEKLEVNPLLHLANFLEKHSIFKIKASYFQRLVTLFCQQSKKIKQTKEISCLQRGRKRRIKFYEEDDGQDRHNMMYADILPFSLHYNILLHPKNYGMMVPEIMKQNQKWIREEKKLFEEHIQMIIQENLSLYRARRRNYDRQLGSYIKRNYQNLSERRWKSILEFNQIQETIEKQKKNKQLNRLLKLVNSTSKMDDDCLPQKHLILDEALRRSDGPQTPDSNIVFTATDFRRHFKLYYETLGIKVKEMRRSFF